MGEVALKATVLERMMMLPRLGNAAVKIAASLQGVGVISAIERGAQVVQEAQLRQLRDLLLVSFLIIVLILISPVAAVAAGPGAGASIATISN